MKAFYVVWGLWFFFEIFLRITQKSGEDKKNTDKGSLNIIWIAIFFGISLGITILYTFNLPFSKNLSVPYIGLFIIIAGIIIRIWAILTLSKSFTVDVAVHSDQKLKTAGLYKFIRHPAYLGSLISFFGMGLSLNNILSFFALVIPVVFAFLYRIKVEEKLLAENFGEKYLDYIKKTKKLIPFVY